MAHPSFEGPVIVRLFRPFYFFFGMESLAGCDTLQPEVRKTCWRGGEPHGCQ
jgi:hypothetical protein